MRNRKIRVPPPVDPLPSAINTFEDFCMFMSAWFAYIGKKYRGSAIKRSGLGGILVLLFKFGILTINL